MSRKRLKKIPCINDAFKMHLRVNLCKTCIDFKRERDFYKESCRVYERQIEELYERIGTWENGTAEDTGEEMGEEGNYGPLSLVKVKLEEIEPEVDEEQEEEDTSAMMVLGTSTDNNVPGSSSDVNSTILSYIPSDYDSLERNYNPDWDGYPKSPAQVEESANLLTCLWKVHGAKGKATTCKKVFRSYKDIKKHVRYHHVIGPSSHQYRCLWKGCSRVNRVFSRRRFMLAHVDRMHVGDQRWHCTFQGCSKSFYLRFDWKKHELTHTRLRYPCAFQGCTKWFYYEPDLKRHELTHTGLKYACVFPGCSKELSQSCAMLNHISTCHPGTMIRKCIVASCDREVFGPDDLSVHLRCHENMETFRNGFPGSEEEGGDMAAREVHEATHVDGNQKELGTHAQTLDVVSVIVQEPEEIPVTDNELEQRFGTNKYGRRKSVAIHP